MTEFRENARTTLSFYRYTHIAEPEVLRDSLRAQWLGLDVLGRVYLAKEGVNAQVSVPNFALETFKEQVHAVFPAIAFKLALEENAPAFVKLKIKVRTKLVADGLDEGFFNVENVGNHLDARAFHQALETPGTLVVDMRNHYECEVGHFAGAILPTSNTFREALPEVLDLLEDKKDHKILLYCTGGIRCEKASAWLKHHGFRDVNQLHGGIIDYARQVQVEGLSSKFVGKNFVFDQRMGERVTADVIAHCHQCETLCDEHTNCAFEGCNRLFLQCPACAEAFDSCCSRICQEVLRKPKEDRVKIQQEWSRTMGPQHYWSRTRLPLEYALKEAEELMPFPPIPSPLS